MTEIKYSELLAKWIRPCPTDNSKVCSINIGDMEVYRKVQESLKEYGISMSAFLTNCCKTYVEITEGTTEDVVAISENPLENVPEWTGNHESIVITTKWYKSLTYQQYKEYDKTVMIPLVRNTTKDDEGYQLVKQRLELHNQAWNEEWYKKEVQPIA